MNVNGKVAVMCSDKCRSSRPRITELCQARRIREYVVGFLEALRGNEGGEDPETLINHLGGSNRIFYRQLS